MSTLIVDNIKTAQNSGFTFNENVTVDGTLNVTGNTVQTGLNVLRTYMVSTDTQFSGSGGSFTLEVEHDDEQPNLVIVLKPTRTDSIFKITTIATAYVGSGYMFWTIGRAINASKTGFTAGDTTVNVVDLAGGGDGTSTTDHMARSHLNAHVQHGAAAIFDQPNTTDYVRYGIHFYENGSSSYYYPHTGVANLIVEELSADNTQVNFGAPLITTE